jgi:hypothetical protein
MSYTWKNNQACKATYVIHTEFLDQIEPVLVPIEKAGEYKVEFMTSFPDDASDKIKEKWAKKISAKLIQYVIKYYDVEPEKETTTVRKWHDDTWPLYKNGDKTLTDIAEVMDKHCKFNDE